LGIKLSHLPPERENVEQGGEEISAANSMGQEPRVKDEPFFSGVLVGRAKKEKKRPFRDMKN